MNEASMLPEEVNSGGAAFLISMGGTLRQILRDDLNLSQSIQVGDPLAVLFDDEGAGRFEQFLSDARLRKATFDWRLRVQSPGGPQAMHFAGGLFDQDILVVAGYSPPNVTINFYEELMRINNEQVNALRSLLKEQVLAGRSLQPAVLEPAPASRPAYLRESISPFGQDGQSERALLEQFTALNNELIGLQRRLAKQNAELDLERERYRQVSELISDFAFSFRVRQDGHLELEWVTDAFQRITGYSAEDVNRLGGPLAIAHPDDHAVITDMMLRLLSGQPDTREFRVVGRDGQIHWLREYSRPIWDGHNQRVARVIGAAQDIAAERQAQEELEQAQERQRKWVQELERRTLEISLLAEMSGTLQKADSFEETYAVIYDYGTRLFPHLSGALLMANDDPERPAYSVARWGRPAVDADEPLVSLPLTAQPATFGELQLWSSNGSAALSEGEYQLALAFAEQVGLVYANLRLRERLKEQAIRDPLTGLYNRRYFFEMFEQQLRQAERTRQPLTLLLFDLDHFKDINDQHGHLTGDAVLRSLGALIHRAIRGADIACRYGGEEFIILFLNAHLDDALARAEQIREMVAWMTVLDETGLPIRVSLSAGLAAYPAHAVTTELLLQKADAALYRAKAAGRNRLMIAS